MPLAIIGGIFIDVKAWPDEAMKIRDSNGGKISYTAGGVARNIAENIGRLGVPVRLFGAVGEDAVGQKVWADTAGAGVDLAHVMRSREAATGTSMIQLDEKGDLWCCTTDMGATALIDENYIEKQWKNMLDSELIIADTELRPEVLQLLLEKANAAKIPVLIEPVSGEKSGKLASLRGELAFFTPNEVEYQQFEKAKAETGNSLRIQHILKTCGEKGVFWKAEGEREKQFSVTKIEILDATGAGDAFVAGFACALYRKKSMEAAIAFGHKLAALTLQSPLAVSEAITSTLLQDV